MIRPGKDAEPGVDLLGDDVLRRVEYDGAKKVDAGGVGGGDKETKADGMAGAAAGADEVGGDDGFTVAGFEGMEGSKTGGEEGGGEEKPEAELARGHQLGEAAAGCGLAVGGEDEFRGW